MREGEKQRFASPSTVKWERAIKIYRYHVLVSKLAWTCLRMWDLWKLSSFVFRLLHFFSCKWRANINFITNNGKDLIWVSVYFQSDKVPCISPLNLESLWRMIMYPNAEYYTLHSPLTLALLARWFLHFKNLWSRVGQEHETKNKRTLRYYDNYQSKLSNFLDSDNFMSGNFMSGVIWSKSQCDGTGTRLPRKISHLFLWSCINTIFEETHASAHLKL